MSSQGKSGRCEAVSSIAEHNGRYYPFTRDTLGIAVKATYCEDSNGRCIQIFKDPKTDSGHFKKSQKGCCVVHYDGESHTFSYVDGLTLQEARADKDNLLLPVFADGYMTYEYSLDHVRENLHGTGGF